MSSATIIPTLKIPALRRLSSLLGLNVNLTKTALLAQLDELPTAAANPTCILSIDMGIRNLAYTVLTTDTSTTAVPTITRWTRTTVQMPSAQSIWLPQFASATHELATSLLDKHKPSHILIERQRWRSGGGTGVLEWTIRVNTVEAMLHACLFSLQAAKVWTGTVESVDPGRVARLWVPDRAAGRTTAAEVKRLKKAVVCEWLRAGVMVQLGNSEVEDTAELVTVAAEGKSAVKRSGEKLTAEEKKVDDLADCVLQAMAWLRWQENRKRLLEGSLPPEMEDMLRCEVPATNPLALVDCGAMNAKEGSLSVLEVK